MPSKLLLALMSAAFAVSATNVYAEDQTKTEAPQAQQIVAEGEKEGEKADLIASAPDWRGDETLDLIASAPDWRGDETLDLIAEGEKEGEKADLIAEGEKEGEKADLIAEGEKEGEKADLIAEGEKEGEKADLIASAPDWRGDETLDLIA